MISLLVALATFAGAQSFGGGGSVTTASLPDGVVETAKLAADAVIEAKILDAAVTARKLGTGAVETVKLGTDSVTGTKILAGVIDSSKFSSGVNLPGGLSGPFTVDGASVSVRGGIVNFGSQPAAGVRVGGSQPIGNNLEQIVGFSTTADFVSGNMFVGSIDTEKLKVPVGGAGRYVVTSSIYVPAVSGRVITYIKHGPAGGTYSPACITQAAGAEMTVTCTRVLNLAAGDYVTVSVNQNSGANMDIYFNAINTSAVQIYKLP